MSVIYETIVKTSPGFIEDTIAKQLNTPHWIYTKVKDNQISFIANKFNNPGLYEILEISKEYPEQLFKATTVCDVDFYNATIFLINNGKIINQENHIWFTFQYQEEEEDKLSKKEKLKFEKKARKYFNIINNNIPDKRESNSLHDFDKEYFSTIEYCFHEKDVIFMTKRIDHEILKVKITYLKERNKTCNVENDSSELPF
jgi:hypothetical protein